MLAQEQQTFMVENDPAELRILNDPKAVRGLEVLQRGLILAQFELAKAEHELTLTVVGVGRDKALKGAGCVGVSVTVVVDGAE